MFGLCDKIKALQQHQERNKKKIIWFDTCITSGISVQYGHKENPNTKTRPNLVTTYFWLLLFFILYSSKNVSIYSLCIFMLHLLILVLLGFQLYVCYWNETETPVSWNVAQETSSVKRQKTRAVLWAHNGRWCRKQVMLIILHSHWMTKTSRLKWCLLHNQLQNIAKEAWEAWCDHLTTITGW